MKIKYTLQIEDVLELADHHYNKNRKFITKFFFILLGTFLITTGLLFIKEYQFEYISISYIILGIILLTFEPILLKKIIRLKTKKAYLKGKNHEVFCENTIEIKEKTITIKSPNITTKLKTNTLESFEENKKYFFLYNTSQTAFIIPKKYFKNNKQELEFRKHFT